MEEIEISFASIEYAESYNQALCQVARERKFLSTVDGFSLESSLGFVTYICQANLAQYYLLNAHKVVVGWCDIIPKSVPEFSHVGVLGIGIIPEYRGLGLGKKLIEKTIAHALLHNHVEKIELVVFDDNTPAISLYQKLGFFEEGKRLKVRKLDGHYQNELLMGKFIA